MRKIALVVAAACMIAGAGAWAWARCAAMTGYISSRPDFNFGPSAAQIEAEIAAARARARELRRERTLAGIDALKSLEEKNRAMAREKRRDGLEDKFQRSYDMSPEQREKIAQGLYEDGQRAERNRSIETAQDCYLFAMQIAPGTDVSIKAHEALIRLDEAKAKLGGASRGQGGPTAGMLTQADLAEIQRVMHGGSEADAAASEKVRQMLEQLNDFTDEKRQKLIVDRLRDEQGLIYTEGLIKVIRQSSGTVRDAARQALVDRFGRMTAATLRDKLTGGEAEARLAAAKAIAAKEKKELIPDLIRALVDKSEEVIQAARQALRKLTGEDFGPKPGASTVDCFTAQQRWERWWKGRQAENK